MGGACDRTCWTACGRFRRPRCAPARQCRSAPERERCERIASARFALLSVSRQARRCHVARRSRSSDRRIHVRLRYGGAGARDGLANQPSSKIKDVVFVEDATGIGGTHAGQRVHDRSEERPARYCRTLGRAAADVGRSSDIVFRRAVRISRARRSVARRRDESCRCVRSRHRIVDQLEVARRRGAGSPNPAPLRGKRQVAYRALRRRICGARLFRSRLARHSAR